MGVRPPSSFVLPKENAPRPVEKKSAWCPNPAWRQVWAKTGVLAGERRIFAVWSPRWARAPCLRKLQVVSPRRYAGTHHGYESNWYPPLSPLPLRSHKIQRSGSGRRNQWNTGDGRSRSGILGATERSEALSARVNTARRAGRDSKRGAGPVRFDSRSCTQGFNRRHKLYSITAFQRTRIKPGKSAPVAACHCPHPPT